MSFLRFSKESNIKAKRMEVPKLIRSRHVFQLTQPPAERRHSTSAKAVPAFIDFYARCPLCAPPDTPARVTL